MKPGRKTADFEAQSVSIGGPLKITACKHTHIFRHVCVFQIGKLRLSGLFKCTLTVRNLQNLTPCSGLCPSLKKKNQCALPYTRFFYLLAILIPTEISPPHLPNIPAAHSLSPPPNSFSLTFISFILGLL